jgi:CheY-like chemotaxis protein
VQRIVGESEGIITVETSPGAGATFILEFPRQTLAAAPQPPLSTAKLPRGNETVLVVEDDPTVRNRAASLLERQGYRVLTAGDGQEAVDVLASGKTGHVSLVFADVIMPGMNAGTLSRCLSNLYPDLRMLFTSGYTAQTIAPEGIVPGEVNFLPKPYDLESLAGKVRTSLDAKPAA